MAKVRYVEWLIAGPLGSEIRRQRLSDGTVTPGSWPSLAYGYQIVERAEVVFSGETLTGEWADLGPRHLIGEVIDLHTGTAEEPPPGRLFREMRSSGFSRALCCSQGIIPLYESDVVIGGNAPAGGA